MRSSTRLLTVVGTLLLLKAPAWAQVTPAPSGARQPPTPRQVQIVYPLAFYTDEQGQSHGECLAARMEIGGIPAGRVRIGVYEPEVGGTTDVWRAATWSAALVAAQLTNFDPRALQLSVETRRSTDGPSAGALLTVGLVAAIRGDKLRDDVTMTGTINPDGTIGPVGGIPLKIDGAAAAGRKIVLIPAGLEEDIDPRTGQSVNLVRYGFQRNIDVRLVQDVWFAYEIFTGKQLPRTEGAELPPLDPRLRSLVMERIERWVKLNRAAREKYDSWPDYTHYDWPENVMQESRAAFDRAQEHLDAENQIAAYSEATIGAAYAWMAHEFGRYAYQLPTHGVISLISIPQRHDWLVKEINLTSTAMREFQPKTFDQVSMYLLAGLMYFEGLCAYEIAEDFKRLHDSKYLQAMLAVEGDENASAGQLRQAMFSIFAGVYQIVAWIDMKLATDYLELASHQQGTPMSSLPSLVSISDFYRRGAEANRTLVDELALLPAAREQEMPVDVARAIFPIADGYMGTAHVGLTRVLPNLQHYLGPGDQLELVRLAGGMYLHCVTASLVAKYYSIGVNVGDNLTIESVQRPEALEQWIAVSRKQSESSIQELLDQDIDATTCLLIYWAGRGKELKPLPQDRFEALHIYFYSQVMAQMLRQLARANADPDAALKFDDRSIPFPPPEPKVETPLPAPPQPSDDPAPASVPAPKAD